MTSGRFFSFARAGTDLRGKFPIGDQHLGLTMLQDIGDGRGIQARVDGVQHGAEHRHAVMRLDHRRHVGKHGRNGVARHGCRRRQRRGQLPRAIVELPIGVAARAVDHGHALGMDLGRTRQERQRRQRSEIRRIRPQAGKYPAGASRSGLSLAPLVRLAPVAPAGRRISTFFVLRTTLPDLFAAFGLAMFFLPRRDCAAGEALSPELPSGLPRIACKSPEIVDRDISTVFAYIITS